MTSFVQRFLSVVVFFELVCDSFPLLEVVEICSPKKH